MFQDMEMGSLISFNMATAMQSQGCAYPNVAPPNASVFLLVTAERVVAAVVPSFVVLFIRPNDGRGATPT